MSRVLVKDVTSIETLESKGTSSEMILPPNLAEPRSYTAKSQRRALD